jgi:hypothetical protein
MDMIGEVFRKSELLETALAESGKRGRVLAEAERAYRVALAKKILLLREDGFPATLIGDLAKGDDEVARLKLDRDCAEAVYDSSREAINVYKKEIDVLREQIDREWKNA